MDPPIEPMLAKVALEVPSGGPWLYEPKWDGFRALAFRKGRGAFIQSRDLNPLDRYFPELHALFAETLPAGCVLDGEIVIAGPHGLDFDALQMRLHPAASRIEKLARETPASFVAFDVLAVRGRSVMARPQAARREILEQLLAGARAPLHLTPMTRDRALAVDWLARFEGAGLDGVVAKHGEFPYRPGERAMIKVKHVRTADCVVTGLRRHKSGADAVGSLQLALHDGKHLHPVGVVSAFSMEARRRLARELAPLLTKGRIEGKPSRWSAGRDASWEALRPVRVCEVKYDHLQGDRFRHPAQFLRWRPDKAPRDCRYDQLEVTTPYELEKVFGALRRAR
jgi:ATP-dependent DNA ligase